MLGAEAFADLAAAYVDDEPSRHPSFRYVGERLPGWLAARRPDAPTLAGLARLEWARADVFDLVDEPSADARRRCARGHAERFGELPLHLVTAHRLVDSPLPAPRRCGTRCSTEIVNGSATPHRRRRGRQSRSSSGAKAPSSITAWSTKPSAALWSSRLAAPTSASSASPCSPTQTEEAAIAQAYGWMSTWLADGLLRSARSG